MIIIGQDTLTVTDECGCDNELFCFRESQFETFMDHVDVNGTIIQQEKARIKLVITAFNSCPLQVIDVGKCVVQGECPPLFVCDHTSRVRVTYTNSDLEEVVVPSIAECNCVCDSFFCRRF